MAKAKATTGEARVLSDIAGVAKSGDVLAAPQGYIKALADAGQVDPHPEAVDYAKANGAASVTFDPDAAAAADEQAGE